MSTADHAQSDGDLGDESKQTSDSAADSLKSRWETMGSESRKTVIYATVAVACLALTSIVEFASRPAAISEYGKVGEEFFPGFTDPTVASGLNVAVIDPDQVEAMEFSVQRLENGQWVIPSHHNYPADAAERLAQTASSVIGITRGAMVTRWEADHAQYGVVNPKVDSLEVDKVEGVGKRLTLMGDDDAVLADYIIGKQVEGESDQYYVRHPDEDEVYVTTLNIDLSTKFTDWIETDLFEINSADVVDVSINDYQFDELKGTVTERDMTTLTRKASNEDWQLAGLDEATEEVDKDAVRETVDAITGLKIAGVRPKQEGLTPDLQLDRTALKSQRDLDRLQSDLISRGFLLQPKAPGSEDLKLISREGELATATNDGLVYNMYFGRVFTGSQEELEIGLNGAGEESTGEGEKQESAAEEGESTEGEAEAEAEGDSGKPGRYVFVTVGFDQKFIGEQAEKPTEPVKSQQLIDAEAEAAKAEEAGDEADGDEAKEETAEDEESGEESDQSADESETEADGEAAEESTAAEAADDDESAEDGDAGEAEEEGEEKEEQETAQQRLERLRNEFKAEQEQYAADLQRWEAFQEEIKEGTKKAEDLNRRFALWYYVIPGDEFDKLALTRGDLVKAKESEEKEEAEGTTSTEPQSNAAVENQAAADKFLEENKSKEGVMTTDSGLQYEILTEGEGDSPTAESRVSVHYKGSLIDGTVFDESGDTPAQFSVGGVIPGWTEALQLMKPGAKWKLYIPPQLAYGEAGAGADIGPNSLLIFEVELLSVE